MKLVVIVTAFLVAGCQCDMACRLDNDQRSALRHGETVLMDTAPDGTQLWGKEVYGRMVYYSTRGTSYSERSGKTSRDVTVPNSN